MKARVGAAENGVGESEDSVEAPEREDLGDISIEPLFSRLVGSLRAMVDVARVVGATCQIPELGRECRSVFGRR